MKKKLSAVFVLIILLQLLSGLGVAKAKTPSVADLMNVAFMPVGKCLYVYGGGWNSSDSAAGIDALTKGVSNTWVEFYNRNNSAYDYNLTRYQSRNGLDCTGYIGWCMYQLFENQYSSTGYVTFSKQMTQTYSMLFGGTFIPKEWVIKRSCGDIMSMSGHAYIILGECSDGSVVFLHSSPPNVSLCGTYAPDGNQNSEAIRLATHYMSTYFPDCYARYPRCSRNTEYLTEYHQMKWNEAVLSDPDGYRNMSAEQILKDIFENTKLYVNDVRIASDEQILIIENEPYVPVRHISEALGGQVEWYGPEQRVDITRNDTKISVYVGSHQGYIGSEPFMVPGLPLMYNGRVYVHLYSICEALGITPVWDQATRCIYVAS